MPGHVFIIESEASLTIGKLSIYETFTDQITIAPQYKTGLNPAKVILRGTLSASEIGGKIYSDTENAQFSTATIGYTTRQAKVGFTLFGKTIYSYDNISNSSVELHYTTDISSTTTSSSITATKGTTHKVVNGAWV